MAKADHEEYLQTLNGTASDRLDGDGEEEEDDDSAQVTEGERDAEDAALSAAITAALREKYRSEDPDGLIHVQSYRLFDRETSDGTPREETVYLAVCHAKYSMYGGPHETGHGLVPTAITFAVGEDGTYSVKEYRTPEDGAEYRSSIREIFPAAAAQEALRTEAYADTLLEYCRVMLTAYLERLGLNG